MCGPSRQKSVRVRKEDTQAKKVEGDWEKSCFDGLNHLGL